MPIEVREHPCRGYISKNTDTGEEHWCEYADEAAQEDQYEVSKSTAGPGYWATNTRTGKVHWQEYADGS